MSIERCAVDVNAARPHRSDRLRLHQGVLAVVFRKLVRPRHGLHLPLALLVSDFVSQGLMRRYKRHWSEHPLVGQFHVDGDVNLVSAAVLFVRPENFVELPLEVTLVRDWRPDPDTCPQLGLCSHRSTKRRLLGRSIGASM